MGVSLTLLPSRVRKATLLWALSTNGPMRFGVLRKNVDGISSRVLTERLRTLEDNGFVFRHYKPTIPPAVTYDITERMKDIEKVLAQLEGLARKWQPRERRSGQRAWWRGLLAQQVGRHGPRAA
jgi:DNA-binding HxlR family transcriptional regulator